MMASRGRGRRSFNVDSVGLSRESLPSALLQPSPVFPVMEMKPLPLTGGEEVEYLLALKQDLRGTMRNLPYYIQSAVTHSDVERYSDKYHISETCDLLDWNTDWRRFPRELRRSFRKPVRIGVSDGATLQHKKDRDKEEVLLKLENLEKNEKEQSSEEEEGGGAQEEQEEEPEEELEEETDYIMSYFDNGEDFEGESDDNMDEAVY
ncbi:DNA-directed RNA polymerase III subunit RPC7-like [Gouania willdenowi]|uniref:DNA-directed RNA polymerase III subunit RPC7-like n=1 Tax=Gouania willdenowi TaxID=441366 RepID=A0A8C5EKF8_GOUWI|nr:DNA-directed RNA polymerase III subunit RPC7-like [Gouania willdenowi]